MALLTEKEFLFVIGSPRSGTSWLHQMLASHPLVVSTVETTMYAKYLAPAMNAWSREKANIDSGRWCKGIPHLLTESEFEKCFHPLLEKCYAAMCAKKPAATHILEKAPENSLHVGLIRRFLPRAKFIHIIRDGRDVVCSMRNVKQRVGHQTEDIGEGSATWVRFVSAARESLEHDPACMEVRYEELLAHGASLLKGIFEFCGVDADDEQVRQILANHNFEKMKTERPTADPDKRIKGSEGHYYRGKVGTWKEELSDEELRVFATVGGEMLVSLGYADRQWMEEWTKPASGATQVKDGEVRRCEKQRSKHCFLRLPWRVKEAVRILTAPCLKRGKKESLNERCA